MWDVFICHASEDKEDFVRPLAEALKKEGVKVWYDEYTLKIGDSLRRKIEEGLQKSTYGIAVLSKNFFSKEWPQDELDGLFERERDGKKVILPIWHDLTASEVRHYSPILAGRVAAKSKDGIPKVIQMIMDEFGDGSSPEPTQHVGTDKYISITAERESFVIGSSIKVQVSSANCGEHLHLVISGPGKYSKGIEVAQPSVSISNLCDYEWKPDSSIIPGKYTVTAYDSEKKIYDTVLVKATKGSVTIYYEGTGSYYIGKKIKFGGTCTAGKKVYLMLKGPNALPLERKLDNLDVLSQKDDETTFLITDVMQDFTWSYSWDTKKIGTQLEEGSYRIYVINSPVTSDYLSPHSLYAYGIISIIIRIPSINGQASQSLFAKGDPITIKGTATGVKYQELIIWIFGEKNTIVEKLNVGHDSSFVYEIPRYISKKLELGQYFVIIQHPMMDDQFSVYFDDEKQYALSDVPYKEKIVFPLTGDEGNHGSKAINLLISELNNPEIDDNYLGFTFEIVPPMIRFEASYTIKMGDTYVFIAKTNLSVHNEIFIEVSYLDTPINGYQEVKPRPVINILKYVTEGNNGENEILFDINTSGLTPGNYIIKASAMDVEISSTVPLKIR